MQRRSAIPAALLRTTPAPAAPRAPEPERQKLTLVMAAPDERVAKVIQHAIRVWAVAPVPYDITVKVIVDANIQPNHQQSLEIITVLAELGGDLDDCEASIPNIRLGFS